MSSALYFPLRGNAHSLLAGAPAASVRRRMILGALMHDRLIVDDGMWRGSAGPSGGSEFRIPGVLMSGPEAFETPVRRGRARGSNFYVAMKRTDSPGPLRKMIDSPTTIGWKATFDPIKRELPHAYPWIDFVDIGLNREPEDLAKRMAREDLDDGVLAGLIPDEFSRKLVIGNADTSLVMGSVLSAGISLDAMHQKVVQARLLRGQAKPIYGGHALSVLFPKVGAMTWEDVDHARQLPGLRDLRAILADIEAAAWAAASDDEQLDSGVRTRYLLAFRDAVQRLGGTGGDRAVATIVGIAIALVTAGFPVLIGVAAGAGFQIGLDRFAAADRQRSWITVADHLTG